MRLRWTSPALRDLEAIGEFIAKDNPAAAAKTVTHILDLTGALANHPHMGRAGRVPGTRELVITDTPFVVPYRVRDVSIEVLAVFHGARRWPEKFD
ncbi:MAG: type II toxin-antitoxin system RelE/ParE family toxin [Xanthobacteraceae bacterium]